MKGGDELMHVRITVTVRGDPGLPAGAALRVRLGCARADGPVVDLGWDLDQLRRGSNTDVVTGQRVAVMMSRMRRLGCRCPLDFSDLAVVSRALATAVR